MSLAFGSASLAICCGSVKTTWKYASTGNSSSFAFGQPLGAGRCLTLGTASISARVIRDGAMPALVALFHVAA
jgi:hypothetical protein